MILARRKFSLGDQARFAAASGDRNPMHLDALRARRTQAGAPVAHGINLLLWALDVLAAQQPGLPPLRVLRAYFNKFVYQDEEVDAVLVQLKADKVRVSLSVAGAIRSKITVELGDIASNCPTELIASTRPPVVHSVPLTPTFEQMGSAKGCLPFQMARQDAEALFPAATRWLGVQGILALASTTYLVGMICPGLHSIYSELSVECCKQPVPNGELSFRVTEIDPRFRSVEHSIAGGGLTGTLKSFVRDPPIQQPSMQSLAARVAPGEFAGSFALVVGGSRGLGELTAKLIATGGGRVLITWHSGKDDAERVASEIGSLGGQCDILTYDVGKSAAEQLARLSEPPTHAYYFATPPIFRPQAEMFVQERLNEFMAVYVSGFWQLSRVLRARQPRLSLFYPSSVAVTERPREMTEYCMAKAAGEVLCMDMNTSLGPSHVTVSRLPRLLTDQTAAITATETANPVDTMLPIVREVQSWPR